MGFFSGIAESVKKKAEEKQREIESARTVASKLKTDELMYLITNNPKKLSVLVLATFGQELQRRMGDISDSRLKMQFNEASRAHNMQAMVLFGNELVERGYVEKDGGFYNKIGRW